MTLAEAKEYLAKAKSAYKNALSSIKEYDTPGGSTLRKQNPGVLLKQVEYWERQVKALTPLAEGQTEKSGRIKFRQGVIE